MGGHPVGIPGVTTLSHFFAVYGVPLHVDPTFPFSAINHGIRIKGLQHQVVGLQPEGRGYEFNIPT